MFKARRLLVKEPVSLSHLESLLGFTPQAFRMMADWYSMRAMCSV